MSDYIRTLYEKPAEWHARRRHRLGGSDANILMGGDDSKIIRLWKEKRGEIEPEDLSDKLAVLMGILSERLNIAWFSREMKLEVTRQGDAPLHPLHDFIGVTLDGWVEIENAVVEAKHVGAFFSFDDVIDTYFPQCQHNMMVTGADHCFLSVIFGNGDWRCATIMFDPFYAAELLDIEIKFWKNNVLGGQPPRIMPVAIPVGEAHRVVDMSGSNSWAGAAHDWLLHGEGAKVFEDSKETLKKLVEPDVKLAFGYGVQVKRDRRGALRIASHDVGKVQAPKKRD